MTSRAEVPGKMVEGQRRRNTAGLPQGQAGPVKRRMGAEGEKRVEIRKAGPATMTSRACSKDGRRKGGTCHNDKPGLWVGKGGLRSYEGWVG